MHCKTSMQGIEVGVNAPKRGIYLGKNTQPQKNETNPSNNWATPLHVHRRPPCLKGCVCCYQPVTQCTDHCHDLSEPFHTLIPCWTPKPLPPRNQCMGWFAPTALPFSWARHNFFVAAMLVRLKVCRGAFSVCRLSSLRKVHR